MKYNYLLASELILGNHYKVALNSNNVTSQTSYFKYFNPADTLRIFA